MKKIKYYLLLGLSLLPTIVFASGGADLEEIIGVIFMEAFVSIHMSLFVLSPLASLITKEGGDQKKTFWTLFWLRVAVLLFFDFFITTAIAFVDFMAVFVGAFVLIPIQGIKNAKQNNIVISRAGVGTGVNQQLNPTQLNKVLLNCTYCNSAVDVNDSNCPNCGAPITGNNISVSEAPVPNYVKSTEFDPIYNLDENKLIEEVIKRELAKAGENSSSKLIPSDLLGRKRVFSILFVVLLFACICSIFFHLPIAVYFVEVVVLFIFYKVTSKYDLIDYLEKEIKSRPSEKISNIIMNTKVNLVEDDRGKLVFIGVIAALVLPLVIFWNPRIMYEKTDLGYAVRFYTFGLTNMTSADIPAVHKGKNVVALRGDVFSNMYFLETVNLPDTIIEIRGQAFKNDGNLKNINIPVYLEYLGGGAFYNCSSITEIVLPDTLTYLGGETFYGASNLREIRLSENITEIRGNTFEDCISLKSIKIPDKVTRIGGHAFYNNQLLANVEISPNSELKEIGSSAFRLCYNLDEIYLPNEDVFVNSRAFKESPTTIFYHRQDNPDQGFIEF